MRSSRQSGLRFRRLLLVVAILTAPSVIQLALAQGAGGVPVHMQRSGGQLQRPPLQSMP